MKTTQEVKRQQQHEPLPQRITEIADPALRQRTIEVWEAANSIAAAFDDWTAWYRALRNAEKVDVAVPYRCLDVVGRAATVLCVNRANAPPFNSVGAASILSTLPPMPSRRRGWLAKHRTEFADHYFASRSYRGEELSFAANMSVLHTAAVWLCRGLRETPLSMLTPAESANGNPPSEKAQDSPPPVGLGENDILVLRILANNAGRRLKQFEIEAQLKTAHTPLSLNTISAALENLRRCGYCLSKGPRSGDAITEAGQKFLNGLPALV